MLLALFACEREQSATPPCKCAVPAHADAHEAPALAKQHAVERMLAQGSLHVHFDARMRGVTVPPKYATDPDLVVRIGRDLVPPISDLDVSQRGIAGTLKFDGQPFHTVVPWAAIFGLRLEPIDQVWDEDIPPEVRQQGSAAH